nr:DUF2953 domain-containing protein [Lachnospiraceae bacterium]
MHILLLILKIVGIVLLILLGIILLLVLLLVFVPFCYRGEGSYFEKKPYAKFRIRYLFPLLQVYVSYIDEKAEGKVKIFGVTVYDFFAPQTEKDVTEQPLPKKKADATETEGSENIPEETERDAENIQTQETVAEDSVKEHTDVPNMEEDTSAPERLSEKISYFIKMIKEKLRSFYAKLKEIKEKGLQLKAKADLITAQIKYYYEVWQMDVTQVSFRKAKRSLLKLWKSIRPRKGNVRLHIGTGDPAGTGQICGFFGMMYPFVGKYVMIEPDFEKQIYEGDFFFKGHLTVFALLRVVWLVLFDKDLKELRKILMNGNKEDKHE